MANAPEQTPSRVRETALLARLALSDEECERLEPEFDSILTHLESLKELELEEVDRTATVGLQNVFRSDEPEPSLPAERLLERAPSTKDEHYVVPRAVGGKE
jgi:aspartyl-tRNA(Asn)/glutamyl-tRNA(Gln) amidotransferase subunit C